MRSAISISAALLLGFVITGATAASAGEPEGLDLYKAHCKVCHAADSEHGEYTPMTLIQMQWERFFDRKYEKKHAELVHPEADGKKVLDVITPELLAKIKTFAIDHAADSEQPMTCGK